MAGLEPLLAHIYHEKQQAGSMLCAQHALNNLLQGDYFTAPDLSDIARGLDELEESYDDSNTGHTSTNMDDTGFFSVQVLDNALSAWGLNLIRWRSEAMRPYQAHPEKQLGFILNLEQHWFTLRRFGEATADMDHDQGTGHWFNMNSFLPAPEWVSNTYLGMVLQQSEAEGYSVFVVAQADPTKDLSLPRTQADMIASTLPAPTSSSRGVISSSLESFKNRASGSTPGAVEGLEDEDYELQAALQASLMAGQEDSPAIPPPHIPPPIQAARGPDIAPTPTLTADPPLPTLSPPASGSGLASTIPGHADLDPVAASMERNRVLLQRMREQQEFAAREMWTEEDLSPEEQTALNERRERRRREEEEEEEQLRKAIEESEALALAQGHGRPSTPGLAASSATRAYDDEDAELQAALRASLEHQQGPQPVKTPPTQASVEADETDDDQSQMSESMVLDELPQPTSVDDVRKARLARFGI